MTSAGQKVLSNLVPACPGVRCYAWGVLPGEGHPLRMGHARHVSPALASGRGVNGAPSVEGGLLQLTALSVACAITLISPFPAESQPNW
jgi:hypothetical protein